MLSNVFAFETHNAPSGPALAIAFPEPKKSPYGHENWQGSASVCRFSYRSNCTSQGYHLNMSLSQTSSASEFSKSLVVSEHLACDTSIP